MDKKRGWLERLPISILHHLSQFSLGSLLAQPLSYQCNYRLHHISVDVSFDKTPNNRGNESCFRFIVYVHVCVYMCIKIKTNRALKFTEFCVSNPFIGYLSSLLSILAVKRDSDWFSAGTVIFPPIFACLIEIALFGVYFNRTQTLSYCCQWFCCLLIA